VSGVFDGLDGWLAMRSAGGFEASLPPVSLFPFRRTRFWASPVTPSKRQADSIRSGFHLQEIL
jgi:hypothetical protein